MRNVATTKLSSKGQVVIPETIREALKLHEGMQFVVFGEGDVIILKSIEPPPLDEFNNLISKARLQAKKAGITKEDIKTTIKAVRKAHKK